jgi:protocatechuate 3,4-dioxygenase beta subunit
MTSPTRRTFVRLVAGGAVAGVAGCATKSSSLVDATPTPDASGACLPTQGDVKGPFFLAGAPMRMTIAELSEPGERLALSCLVLGPDCATPLANVHVDVWQADRDGNYHDASEQYRLRGQLVTDALGAFRIETVRPGAYLQAGGYRPAHLHFTFTHPAHRVLTTQIYFAGDPYLQPNDSCPSCGSDDASRILTLAGSAAAGWSSSLEIVLAAT